MHMLSYILLNSNINSGLIERESLSYKYVVQFQTKHRNGTSKHCKRLCCTICEYVGEMF